MDTPGNDGLNFKSRQGDPVRCMQVRRSAAKPDQLRVPAFKLQPCGLNAGGRTCCNPKLVVTSGRRFFKLINVLITGGAGYIGSHAAKALALAGFQPVVLDNLSTGNRQAVQWGPLIEGDVRDKALIEETVAAYRINAVLHFAANAYVGESMVSPRKYFQNNVANSLELLGTLIDIGVRHVVFSSTCATYGVPEHLPIREEHRQAPINPYGESKLFIEKALRWYGRAHGLSFVCLRYFNAAGADPDGEIGECHDPETHLIPLVLQAATDDQRQATIFGTDYATPDGTAVRDYTHVSDLADGHVRALKHLLAGGMSLNLNLGTGTGYSVRSVISSVERVSGKRVRVIEKPRRPGDPDVLIANAAKARELLGWRPAFSSLDAIVQTAWSWHTQRCAAATAV